MQKIIKREICMFNRFFCVYPLFSVGGFFRYLLWILVYKLDLIDLKGDFLKLLFIEN